MRLAGVLLALWLVVSAPAAFAEQLVFGSFHSAENAGRWAERLTGMLDHPFRIEQIHDARGTWYRVSSEPLEPAARQALADNARARNLRFWTLRQPATDESAAGTTLADEVTPDRTVADRMVRGGITADPPHTTAAPDHRDTALAATGAAAAAEATGDAGGPGPQVTGTTSDVTRYLDLEVGLQSRFFRERGLYGQDRVQPSVSARIDYRRSWDDARQSLNVVPFVRFDAVDSERSHFDLRQFYWSRVGGDWELHAGLRQIFWGVTEFNHLVDIINQTDLVENIDGEDKLGQPMLQLSLVRDWGIVDLFLLTGFRERTFPGTDGRLRAAVPIDTDDALYASGAEERRVDGAIRWSHYWGPLNFGLHHFSGTARAPELRVAVTPAGDGYLHPYYPVVERTGTDAQLLIGDWAFKLEALRQSGNRDRHHAATLGFERTLVGAFGSRADLGLVVEYLWDERGAAAYDTLFENDLAFGTRWQFNDMQDTQALLGVIRDLDTDEYLLSLEASRRLGAAWELQLEGRWFGGARRLDPNLPWPERLQSRYKSAPLQQDDYLQLELTRYF